MIAPVAIVAAALAVGVGGGGLGGLRSIGQALNGPQLPQDAPAAGRGAAGDAGKLLKRVRSRPSGRGGPVAAAPGGGSTSTSGTPGSGSPGDGNPQTTPTPSPGRTPTPTSTPPVVRTPVPTQSGPPPVAAATPTPSLIRGVGDGVKNITGRLPAGQTTGQVVDLLVQTVEGLQPKTP